MGHDEASWLRLEPRPGERLTDAAERVLREAIQAGSLRPGVRLPSSRSLAAQLGVSRGIVTDAYEQLAAQGYLVSRTKAAPLVAETPVTPGKPTSTRAPAERIRFDFTPTTPDVAQFPAHRWATHLAAAARSMPVSGYDYGDPRGTAELREVLAGHLGRTRGVVADPENILVVHGAAQGVDLVMRTLAAGGAGKVAVEDPSLPSQAQRIIAQGLEAQPVPVDAAGVTIEDLDAAAVIVTPAHQFPTGVVLSGERRRGLLDWARRTGGLIVEDDYDAEFRYDRQPVRALQGLDPPHVVYVGTTSKTLAPALRLGWVVLPADLMAAAQRIRNLLDVCPTGVDQRALASFIQRGDHDRHVRRARKTYQRRRALFTAALARRLPGWPVEGIAAGMHLVLRLPPELDDREVAARARKAGVHVEPLSLFSRTGTAAGALVLGYGRIPERDVDAAVAALARSLRPADA